MKIKVSLTIEMTAEQMEAYYREYGCAQTATEIREDVKSSILNNVQSCYMGENFFHSVTLNGSTR